MLAFFGPVRWVFNQKAHFLPESNNGVSLAGLTGNTSMLHWKRIIQRAFLLLIQYGGNL